METVGQRIRRLRLEHGYTQAQLAARVGVTQRAIGHYEADARGGMEARVVFALAITLSTSMDYIWTGEHHVGQG